VDVAKEEGLLYVISLLFALQFVGSLNWLAEPLFISPFECVFTLVLAVRLINVAIPFLPSNDNFVKLLHLIQQTQHLLTGTLSLSQRSKL
jgi:hypothetical protein